VEQTAQEEYQDIGLVGRMIRVFYAPSETFEAVQQRHTWLDWFAPIVLVLVLGVVAIQITMPVIQQTQREMVEEMVKNMPEEQRKIVLERAEGGASPVRTILGGAVSILALIFVGAVILLILVKLVLGGEVPYGQMLVVYAYSSLVDVIAIIVRVPLVLAKNTAIVHTGLGVFVSEEMGKTFLGRALAGFDLFGFWQICLISIGLGILTRSSTKKAFIPMLILWVIWIVVKAALAGLPGMFAQGG